MVMRYAVAAMLISACSNATTDGTDAQIDSQSDSPTCSVKTWGDAYAVWVDAQCSATERCFPTQFVETYGDHANCVVVASTKHCTQGAEAWCMWKYPVDRCDMLSRCSADMATQVCGTSEQEAPPACYKALDSTGIGD